MGRGIIRDGLCGKLTSLTVDGSPRENRIESNNQYWLSSRTWKHWQTVIVDQSKWNSTDCRWYHREESCRPLWHDVASHSFKLRRDKKSMEGCVSKTHYCWCRFMYIWSIESIQCVLHFLLSLSRSPSFIVLFSTLFFSSPFLLDYRHQRQATPTIACAQTHTHERICRQFRWKNNEWRMVCIWWFFRIVSGGAVSILFTYRHPSLIPMFTHARLVSKGNPVCLRAFGSEQCAWDQLDKRKLIDG